MSTNTRLDVFGSFPFKRVRPMQRPVLTIIGDDHSGLFELPTGTGKTAIGIAFLGALAEQRQWPLFYVTPTKALVEQIKAQHPEVAVAYGRGEHPCLYYDEPVKANEIPCSLLVNCPHRVNQETGETFEPGAAPCPYLQQKYVAKQAPIVVSTVAFYLFTTLFSKEWGKPAGLVIDEVHRLPDAVRSVLSYEITDYYLDRCIELLATIDEESSRQVRKFRNAMVRIVRKKPSREEVLLTEEEIGLLIRQLSEINVERLRSAIQKAVASGDIDPRTQRKELQQLEVISRTLPRYLHSFEYALATEDHNALNYTFAVYRRKLEGEEKAQHLLVVKGYYVAPLIRHLLSPRTVAYSATIGEPSILRWLTGISPQRARFHTFPSTFSPQHARIFLPRDVMDLAYAARGPWGIPRTLRRIARASKSFAARGHRSLVVVISEHERKKFLALCEEEGVQAMSYGNGVAAKEAALRFRDGEGDVLVGTTAHFGEGIDLPRRIAPVIFFLRPGYPPPKSPEAQFEERRFGKSQSWAIRNWRVMIQALQVRGRNIRAANDLGVTFFMSDQFRRFLFPSLPEWLQQAYVGDQTFKRCVNDSLKLLEE